MASPTADASRKRARRDRILTIRAANPQLTQPQIAKLAGVSPRTVATVIKESRLAIAEATNALGDYQQRLRQIVTIQERAETLCKIARNEKSPREQLKALVRIDDLDGIVTEKDRLRYAMSTIERNTQALFQLPAGATISIGFSSLQGAEEPECIDVKASEVEDHKE